MIEFLYPWMIIAGVILLLCSIVARYYTHKPIQYTFPLTSFIKKALGSRSNLSRFLRTALYALRIVAIISLIIALARPRIPDYSTRQDVEGVDIMMVLDVSGSMQCFDDMHDRRPRFEVARTEAIKFINQRVHDPIGLVLFGATAITRCPLTLDKKLLVSLIDQTKIGDLDPDGTVYSIALSMAVNRLKTSKARSKIIIALTDGSPSEHDIDPHIALDLAKKNGIKIYTIGIGGEHGGYIQHQMYGLCQMPSPLNKQLLYECARQTGGTFFEAKNPKDVERIYGMINDLETTTLSAPSYQSYFEYFTIFLWIAYVALLCELVLALWLVVL
ncbi:MAG: VWA domain-containing protein [Candidatus Babeliaceae bacterium]|jgi:Ca-activated chloride channel family protein